MLQSDIHAKFQNLHRGGYVGGSASQFTGNDIIRESGDGVVFVAIQYRLGLFGFLPGQKVKDSGQLNAGLRKAAIFLIFVKLTIYLSFDRAATEDQQFALKWTQEHVRSSASLTR